MDTVVYWLTMLVVLVVSLPFAAAGARSRPRSNSAATPETRLVELGNGVLVEFTKKAGGGASWSYLGLHGEPRFMMHATAQRVLTQQQLAVGEDPWFPEVAAQLAAERQKAERELDAGTPGQVGLW